MEGLLKNDFTSFYHLPISTTSAISFSTNEAYFELEDTDTREVALHITKGGGMAIYRNVNRRNVIIINYDKFVSNLPHDFQEGKRRCDLIVYTDNYQYFLLNELKDRIPNNKVRNKAKSQLKASLRLLIAVPSIQAFINNHTIKQCCYFNKQSTSPPNISATRAFNRINTLSAKGFKMSDSDIESFGFELFEYSGNQEYVVL
jgi:hypothetical protein